MARIPLAVLIRLGIVGLIVIAFAAFLYAPFFFFLLFLFSVSIVVRQPDPVIRTSTGAGLILGMAVAFFLALNIPPIPQGTPSISFLWNVLIGIISGTMGFYLPAAMDKFKAKAVTLGVINAMLAGASVLALYCYYSIFAALTDEKIVASFAVGMIIGLAGYVLVRQGPVRSLIAFLPPRLYVTPAHFSTSSNCLQFVPPNAPAYWKCTALLSNYWFANDDIQWNASNAGLPGVTFIPSSGTLAPGNKIQVEITVPDPGNPGQGQFQTTFTFSGPANSVTISWTHP